MKNSIYKEKFKTTNFVKPLYRVKFSTVTPKFFNDIDRTKLVGDVVDVTKNVSNVTFKETQKYKILPGGCEETLHYGVRCDKIIMEEERKVKSTKTVIKSGHETQNKNKETLDLISTTDENCEETWLRLVPAPVLDDEGSGSIIIRFIACQLGITVFLVLWTALWVAVIHSYEWENEAFVNDEYHKQQNQLVIDLATELRQVTPVSDKWHDLIEARIEEARRQTMIAAGKGAKLAAGRYWTLAGTFLFTVYVMTALGFGAPVPVTSEGRCFALIYAVFAVPFHVFLMMQASKCAVAHLSYHLAQCHKSMKRPRELNLRGKANSEDEAKFEIKSRRKRKKLSCILSVLTTAHGVPVACLLYYTIGVLIFGIGRRHNADVVEILMFPLQFTTNGGLASVESHFRVLYGLYVEGAMALLMYCLAAMRRSSGNTFGNLTVKYRLYTSRPKPHQ